MWASKTAYVINQSEITVKFEKYLINNRAEIIEKSILDNELSILNH